MKMNIEALLNIMDEVCECEKDYYLCMKKRPFWGNESYEEYSKKKNIWDKNYNYYLNEVNKANCKEDGIFEVLGIRHKKAERAKIARRALKKWYERTKWERCPDSKMMRQFGDFIFFEKSKTHYDLYAEIGDRHRFIEETYVEFTDYSYSYYDMEG